MSSSLPVAKAVSVLQSGGDNIPYYQRENPAASGRYPQESTLTDSQIKSHPQESTLTDSQIKSLLQQGYTRGLAKSLNDAKKAFSHHFWIVDNSGSMQNPDGHRMAATSNRDNVKMIPCTRWEEIQECVLYHIQLAALLEAPTRFRLLNDPGAAVGPQTFSVAETPTTMEQDVREAQRIMRRARPGGCTPLTQHILQIRREVSAMAPTLRANGQRVTIQIATDGLPTDERGYGGKVHQDEFVRALRSLEGLPVWVVVRLCTDEDHVVSFYNDLDAVLELSMEVLDDFTGEAEEVYSLNPWLCYGIPIQRMREMGFHDRVFDMLDERKLTKSELWDFFYILFGEEKMDGVADPNFEWLVFCKDIDRLLQNEQKQWDPIRKRMKPWVDIHALNRMYGTLECSCTIL